jgi:hypothetical protein
MLNNLKLPKKFKFKLKTKFTKIQKMINLIKLKPLLNKLTDN